MAQMTKKGALAVSSDLDRIASLFQTQWKTLGVPKKIATDFAYKCDLLADRVEATAGLHKQALTGDDPVKEPGFDPEGVGQEKSGPQEQDADEGFMEQHFTQQEKRELRETQEDGDIGPDKTKEERQTPTPGIQASLIDGYRRLRQAGERASIAENRDVVKLGADLRVAGDQLLSLAVAGGDKAVRAEKALNYMIPHLASVEDPEAADVLAKMAAILAKIAEEDEEAEEDEGTAKEAGCEKLPEGPMRDNCEKKRDEGDEGGKEDKEDKEAADHGYNLFA